MLKKYTAKSHVSVSVIFPNGKGKHISFSPLTGGSSVYYTSCEDEQAALEAHPRFGKLFKATVIQDEAPKPKSIIGGSEAAAASAQAKAPIGPAPVSATGMTQIKVACLDDAKEYLCEHFDDVQRSKLRGRPSITAAAAAHNIEFVGI